MTTMKLSKTLEDITFHMTQADPGRWISISEPIVIGSAAGWYIGAIYGDPDGEGPIRPWDRYTDYYPSEAAAQSAFDKRPFTVGAPSFLAEVEGITYL